MRRPSAVRLLLGLGGVTLIGVGIFNSLALGFVNLLWLLFWLATGLILHDGVLAPGTAAMSKLATDRWSVTARRSLLVAVVCIGSLTLIALPLVVQHNAVPGNPTLLGRNYLLGWALASLLVLVGAGVAEVIGRLRSKGTTRQSTTRR